MKMKMVRVLDDSTDVYYLIGKPELADKPGLDWTGWEMKWKQWDKITSPTLIVKPRSNTTTCAMSHFDVPQIDLVERGNIEVDHTSVALTLVVRDLCFEEIPDTIDVSKIMID